MTTPTSEEVKALTSAVDLILAGWIADDLTSMPHRVVKAASVMLQMKAALTALEIEREGLDIALAPNVLARLIADNLGFPIDQALRDKSEWNALRGEKGGRYHDINEPFQTDYLDAGKAVAEYIRASIPKPDIEG